MIARGQPLPENWTWVAFCSASWPTRKASSTASVEATALLHFAQRVRGSSTNAVKSSISSIHTGQYLLMGMDRLHRSFSDTLGPL